MEIIGKTWENIITSGNILYPSEDPYGKEMGEGLHGWNIIKQMQIHQGRIFYGGHESRHTWADPRLWSCHYRCWYGPTKLRFHFPRLQHKWFCERSWADVGLWSCRHHILEGPRSQSYRLRHTTQQTQPKLQLSLKKNTIFDDVTMNEIQPAG